MLKNNIVTVNMGVQNLTGWHFMALVTVCIWIFSIRLLILAYRSVRWPTAEGKITKSAVVRSKGQKGQAVWQPQVQFQYEVAGKSFSGKTISYRMSGGTTAAASTMTVNNYPVGKAVVVYYDSASPRRAVLENGPGPNTWVFLFITTLLAAVFIWAAFFRS